MQARRYNTGKLRYGLIPAKALANLAEVYTRGAHKHTLYKDKEGNIVPGKDIPYSETHKYEIYDDGSDNWRKGLPWMSCIDSTERHIQAFKNGEDIDELGTYHLANAVWNLFTILEYYNLHPELDDRKHQYLNRPKIGLDIDDVICDWVGTWCKKHGLNEAKSWCFSYSTRNKLELTEELKQWYLDLPAKMNPDDLPFEPHCYITSRSIPQEITEAWIEKNGFPTVPVYTVPFGASKVDVAKESGVDMFIDDGYKNFVELNKAGICTYLLTTTHNKRYDVGYKRIDTVKELFERFK